MFLSNKLTIFRIALVVPFLGLLIAVACLNGNYNYWDFDLKLSLYLGSGLIFIIAMTTDFLDGYIARKRNEVSEFGKLWDPLADKIITTTAFIMLTIIGIIPFPVVILFIIRDVIVDGSRNLAARKGMKIEANWWGKSKTIAQSLAIISLFILLPIFKIENKDVFSLINNPFKSNITIWLINIPTFIAVDLSIVSGFIYLKKMNPIFKEEKNK
ncbi:MAG: CDP-diacylglycerol--glycerol-3-phosphate 3-phosphatidyltransferase, partial [Mollicutes bacterium PWAP]|nr:CDP-diacylglycerol--glycerol-3-phosphate 3-phosphatidyltransferase [Mollicutes bacterium PWAP]